MREILFRGKNVENEWKYGNLVLWKDDRTTISTNNSVVEPVDYFRDWVRPETIGEYTGIKDKHGNKIFEGDITVARSNDKSPTYFDWPPAITEFENGMFVRKDYKLSTAFSAYSYNIEFEIIGNIYDNPELMEEEQ